MQCVSEGAHKKYKYYRVAIYALILAAFAFLLAVIIYPVQFAKDLENDDADNDDDNDGVPDSAEIGGARVYTFGYGYGAVWGSIILLFAAIVLLICDRESEEIFYKEKQVEEEEEDEGEA